MCKYTDTHAATQGSVTQQLPLSAVDPIKVPVQRDPTDCGTAQNRSTTHIQATQVQAQTMTSIARCGRGFETARGGA
jgi:hypothetical protein